MVETVSVQTDTPPRYQQALDDFGVEALLSSLSNYVDNDFNATEMNLEDQELKALRQSLSGD